VVVSYGHELLSGEARFEVVAVPAGHDDVVHPVSTASTEGDGVISDGLVAGDGSSAIGAHKPTALAVDQRLTGVAPS